MVCDFSAEGTIRVTHTVREPILREVALEVTDAFGKLVSEVELGKVVRLRASFTSDLGERAVLSSFCLFCRSLRR